MESPRMYDTHLDEKLMTVSETSVAREISNGSAYLLSEDSVSDLSDLNTAEISLDLQGLIDDSQFPETDGVFFPELLENKANTASNRIDNLHLNGLGTNGPVPRTTSSGMPPANNVNSYRGQSLPGYIHHNVAYHHPADRSLPVKQEPHEGSNNNNNNNYNHCIQAPVSNSMGMAQNHVYTAGTYTHLGGHGNQDQNSLKVMNHHHTSKSSHSKHKKNVDKGTDEYRRRRERNNIAVRKSREKAKQRSRDTEVKVKDLQRENERLQKRVDQLTRDLHIMRNVVTQVGGPLHDTVQRELTRYDGGMNPQCAQ